MTDQTDRIDRAEAAVNGYTGGQPYEINLRDLLTDLRHWCDLHDIDFDAADRMAKNHYELDRYEEAVDGDYDAEKEEHKS